MKSDKRHLMDGLELPKRDNIRTLGEKKTDKYLGILKADTIKQREVKEKNKNKYLRRIRKLFKTKLSSRNIIKRINTWAVRLIRYTEAFLKCIREELKQMDQSTIKVMIMHEALHPR